MGSSGAKVAVGQRASGRNRTLRCAPAV